jgi:hypothetical protein
MQEMKPEDRAYYEQNRQRLEQMKREAIASIPCQRAVTKMWYDCPCGASIVAKNLQFHYVSKRHRSVCGHLGDEVAK